MKFFAVAVAAFASTALAAPTNGGSYEACPHGLFSVPQCCGTDILGVADLDCDSPAETPRDARNFKEVCAKGGQRARCCVLPALQIGVLCTRPVGVDRK